MSSIFSTVINFGMLGLLRRLHRMHAQFCLESESQETGIRYSGTEAHKKKDGHGNLTSQCLGTLTDSDITTTIRESREEAKQTIKTLGMYQLLYSNSCWDNPPSPLLNEIDFSEVDEEDGQDDDIAGKDIVSEILQEANSSEDDKAVATGISDLFTAGITSRELCNELTLKHATAFKKVPSSTVSLFEQTDKKSRSLRKHCPYVVIKHEGKDIHINKTTVVWMLQEGERISCDRLFRVRNKQPYSNDSQESVSHQASNKPTQCDEIALGDVCVFKDIGSSDWQLGKVLKFSYYKQKTKASQQFRGLAAKVTLTDTVGVLCSWFSKSADCERVYTYSPPNTTSSDDAITVHSYIPISSYVCTLTKECFECLDRGSASVEMESVLKHDSESLSTMQKLTLSKDTLLHVNEFLKEKKRPENEVISKQEPYLETTECWTQYGGHVLTRRHLQQIVQGKKLCDLHINAFQCLLKKLFPHINGLQCTLFQDRTPLKLSPGKLTIQILFTRKSHWATLAIQNNDICLYNSSHTSVCEDTMRTISNLIRCKEKSFTVKLMNTTKQSGAADCGLYAVAVASCLALEEDPTTIVFNQQELRSHFSHVLEKGEVKLFPVKQRRRPESKVCGTETVSVYCYCRMPDHGKLMVECSTCSDWFHEECIREEIPAQSRDEWSFMCTSCNMQSS